MNINWYPGHMKKTMDLLRDNLKLVDLVIEVIDARIPYSSKNPDFEKLFVNKKRVLVINKYDLANPNMNKKWEEYYKSQGYYTVLYNSTDNKELKKIEATIGEATLEIVERYRKKGIQNKVIKTMIVGIPNAGKSTLINSIAKKKSTKTGNMPGVTKGKQWIRLPKNIDLLDTPGILWPKFISDTTALNLAFTGAIKEEILQIEEIAYSFIEIIAKIDKKALANRYGIEVSEVTIENMDNIARKRGCILNKNEIDYPRVSRMVLDEFQNGKLGRISLERPEDVKNFELDAKIKAKERAEKKANVEAKKNAKNRK
ncbi:ribosome biogenesis GTPase YlqF [Sedimentibacter sp. zth1]|uniref:ribosome biogenesis GTPase YlqF n=1 Tax=Sedimentibacter sp. zth1 TaxID=2816908 RepID=UPI001A93555C|nr:ribosome biogenesis GTPase YlqF [Sedimentibacter sp. zth1]QSX06566.1 ribosome biogenesis GTPase YlqF [Sedimentibacter sp. zth1]